MKVRSDHVAVGRVINDDGDFLLLEIAKNEDAAFTLDEEVPDQFYTMLFVSRQDDGSLTIFNPWEE